MFIHGINISYSTLDSLFLDFTGGVPIGHFFDWEVPGHPFWAPPVHSFSWEQHHSPEVIISFYKVKIFPQDWTSQNKSGHV